MIASTKSQAKQSLKIHKNLFLLKIPMALLYSI